MAFFALGVIILLSFGKFDQTAAQCADGVCGAPPTSSNVRYTPATPCYTDTETVTYQCNGTLSGSPNNTCVGGSWTQTSATCTVSCSAPTVENGVVSPSGLFAENDTADISCESGYSLEAGLSEEITCGAYGIWTTVPRCIAVCRVPGITHSTHASGGTLDHGEVAYINCTDGYSYQQEEVFEVVCLEDGLRATTGLPSKCFMNCEPRSSPTNGNVTGDYKHGSTATFSCFRGYGIANLDDATTTCYDGIWSRTEADPPNCAALEGEERMTLTCGSQRFKVEIPVDLVNAANIDLIHLKDRSCTAAEVPGESNYLYMESTYEQCGTTGQVDSARKEVTYVNKIQAELSRDGKTSQQRPLDIDINCKFDQSNVVSTSVIVANEITSALAIFGHYFTLSIYLDEVFSVEETPPVYIMEDYPAIVKLQMEAEKNETLAASDCYVTPSSDPSDPDFRDIIHDGCAVISEITILDISSQSSKPAMAFSMSRMHFGGDSDEVFVHCYAASCKDDSCGATCPSSRRRRSVNAYHLLTQGPIIWQEYEPGLDGDMAQAVALMVFSGVVATISLIIIIFVAYRCLCRKKPEPKLDLYY